MESQLHPVLQILLDACFAFGFYHAALYCLKYGKTIQKSPPKEIKTNLIGVYFYAFWFMFFICSLMYIHTMYHMLKIGFGW